MYDFWNVTRVIAAFVAFGSVALGQGYKSQRVTGKVVSVQKFGKRFSVRLSRNTKNFVQIGSDVRVNRGDARIGEGRVAQIDSDWAVCNIKPTSDDQPPQVGDRVSVKRVARTVPLVVAKHVVFMDGEVVPWSEVLLRLDELARREVIQVRFRITREKDAPRRNETEKLSAFRAWAQKAGIHWSHRHMWTSDSRYYDSIKSAENLEQANAIIAYGVVVSGGKLLSGVEVAALPQTSPRSTNEVYVSAGRLRDPASQPHRTVTRNGRFRLYPPTEKYQVIALHETGMALVTSDELRKDPRIKLKPWASISGRFEDPDQFDQSTSFDTLRQRDGWASVWFYVWRSPQHANGSFAEKHIPPGRIRVGRSILSPRGGGTPITDESFDLAPGQTRNVTYTKLTGKKLEKAEAYISSELK